MSEAEIAGSRRLSRSVAGTSHRQADRKGGKRRVTFVLENISLSVGAGSRHRRRLADARAGLDERACSGPTLAGKTTLMRLMAGLGPADDRAACSQTAWTSRRLPVRRRSVAMVYQQFVNYPSLTVYENIASPLRVAGVGRAEIDARVKEAARLLRLEQSSAAPAGATVRRAAATHRDRPRSGQARRTGAARRAARQSRLQAARGIARGIAAHLRPDRRRPGLRDDGADGGAAARRHDHHACTRAASLRSARPPRVYRRPENIEAARVFSDPPLNELVIEKRGPLVTLEGGRNLPLVGALSQTCRMASIGSASAPTPSPIGDAKVAGPQLSRRSRGHRTQRVGKLRSRRCRHRRLGVPRAGRARVAARARRSKCASTRTASLSSTLPAISPTTPFIAKTA